MEPLTNDERLLLRFQSALVRYRGAALMKLEDPNYEIEFCQALMALDDLDDPILKDLADQANGANLGRSEEAQQELLALSYRVKNLFPQISRAIN
jgi:hypothetical protein